MPDSARTNGKTLQINAGVVVAHQDNEHRILTDGVVVVRDGEIIHVGRSWDGTPDEVMDAKNKVVTPGFITTHLHSAESPLDKSWIEDIGTRQFSYSGLSEMLPARGGAMNEDGRRASATYSQIELLKTGTTTAVEQGGSPDYVLEAARESGIRAYIAPIFKSGRWLTRNGSKMEYEWTPEAGEAGLNRALEFIKAREEEGNDRIRGFLAPAQVDTSTEELLVRAKAASDELDVPLTLHASQSVFEFDEMVQRHGLSPIEWLEKIGFLGERTFIGHGIYIAGMSWVQFAGNDLEVLARNNATVAHSPWVFARRGIALESFPEYIEAGVNVTLGTDTAPQSMIEAMRLAAMIGKITGRQANRSTAGDAFNAATVNAANLLGRPDLGRVQAGAKADLLFWSLDSLFMAPVRDVIKNIVYSATPGDLWGVMVDGELLVEDGEVLRADEAAAIAALQREADGMWSRIQDHDWAGRTADEMSPQTFAPFE